MGKEEPDSKEREILSADGTDHTGDACANRQTHREAQHRIECRRESRARCVAIRSDRCLAERQQRASRRPRFVPSEH